MTAPWCTPSTSRRLSVPTEREGLSPWVTTIQSLEFESPKRVQVAATTLVAYRYGMD